MDNIREKLVELVEESRISVGENGIQINGSRDIANHLISNGVTVQEWIPVAKRLPEPFETVCVYDATAKTVVTAYITRHREWVGVCMSHKITHWAELPQPPKGE